MRVWERVDLPEPLGPMTACTSPLLMPSVTPLRISLPSTLALRSLISKSDNFSSVSFHFIVASAGRFGHPRGPADRRSEKPLVHLLLIQARQPCPGGDILDGSTAPTARKAAPLQINHPGHGRARR